MKTRKIILIGLVLFISGLSMMLIDVNFKSIPIMQTDVEIFLVIGLASFGLFILGITVVNEFVKYRYELRK